MMNVYELNEPIACDRYGETVGLARKLSACVRQCTATAIELDRLRAEAAKMQAGVLMADPMNDAREYDPPADISTELDRAEDAFALGHCDHGVPDGEDCADCIHDDFIREVVRGGECFHCGPDGYGKYEKLVNHICPRCGWDAADYM